MGRSTSGLNIKVTTNSYLKMNKLFLPGTMRRTPVFLRNWLLLVLSGALKTGGGREGKERREARKTLETGGRREGKERKEGREEREEREGTEGREERARPEPDLMEE